MARALCLIGIFPAMAAFMFVAWFFDVGHADVEKLPECKRWVAFNTCRWKSGVVF